MHWSKLGKCTYLIAVLMFFGAFLISYFNHHFITKHHSMNASSYQTWTSVTIVSANVYLLVIIYIWNLITFYLRYYMTSSSDFHMTDLALARSSKGICGVLSRDWVLVLWPQWGNQSSFPPPPPPPPPPPLAVVQLGWSSHIKWINPSLVLLSSSWDRNRD